MFEKRQNKIRGDIGEEIARSYLKQQGYKIVESKFTNKIGEIDIIAYDKETLVFVEVKYRKNNVFGLPREAVDERKQRKIRMVASSYINRNRLFDKQCRFDVVEILDKEINLIKDCF